MNMISQFLVEFWMLTGEMAPYLLFGFLMAGVLSVVIKPDFVERHLGRRGLRQTLKATVVGVPMPLCSCGVIPVAASLRRHGAGKGATTAFLASTPQTGVDSIAATWGMMNPLFALVRVLAAFASGIVSGVLVDMLDTQDEEQASTGVQSIGPSTGFGHKVGAIFKYGFVTLPADIGKSLAVGLVLAGILGVAIPSDFFAGRVQGELLTFVVMTLVAVPMYVCSTGSIPVAVAFMNAGITPGAALVFLIAGPATNAATISTLWKVAGRRTVAIYLFSIIVMAWICGFLFNLLPNMAEDADRAHVHAMGGLTWAGHLMAILLVGVVVHALWRGRKNGTCCENADCSSTAGAQTYLVEGMRCSRCAEAVERSIGAIQGTEKVRVDLASGRMDVAGSGIDKASIFSEVRALGYDIEERVPED